MSLLHHLLAILGLAALTAGWVLIQRWLGYADPEVPGVEAGSGGGCGGCGGGGGCGKKVCKTERG